MTLLLVVARGFPPPHPLTNLAVGFFISLILLEKKKMPFNDHNLLLSSAEKNLFLSSLHMKYLLNVIWLCGHE